MKIAPGGTSQIADAPREASASRPRRRRSATHTPHSSRQLHEPPRPRPGTARPRGRFDSARRSRHRPRRPRRRRWRTSRRCTRSPGRRTRRSRAGRMPSAPHSVPRSPCSAARAGRLQPAASAHAPRSGGERRGSSPSRSRTSHRSSPVGGHRAASPASFPCRHAPPPCGPPLAPAGYVEAASHAAAINARPVLTLSSRSPGPKAACMPSLLAGMGRSRRLREGVASATGCGSRVAGPAGRLSVSARRGCQTPAGVAQRWSGRGGQTSF